MAGSKSLASRAAPGAIAQRAAQDLGPSRLHHHHLAEILKRQKPDETILGVSTPITGRFAISERSAVSSFERAGTVGMSACITSSTGVSGPRSFSALIMASRVSTPRRRPALSTIGNSVWVVRIRASAASLTVAEVPSAWNLVINASENERCLA